MTLPAHIIAEDRRLLNQIESASEALGQLRWHWTLDETNPDRVSMTEYARQVGVDRTQIGRYARAHQYWLSRDPRVTTYTDALELGRMGAETYAATEAIAQSRGRSIRTVRDNYGKEVERVREIARERAEKHGTSVAEEAPKVAETITRAEAAGRQIKAERAERIGLRYVEMERLIDSAKRTLVGAVNLAHEIDWGDEERQLLSNSLNNLQAVVKLIDMAFVESVDVDWDAELARLSKER